MADVQNGNAKKTNLKKAITWIGVVGGIATIIFGTYGLGSARNAGSLRETYLRGLLERIG